MKYYKRLKIYKNQSGTNVFNPELIEATSYRWFVYVKKIGSVVFFNNHPYSLTTGKHQREVWKVLNDLGIEYVTIDQTQSLGAGLYLDGYYRAIAENELRLENAKTNATKGIYARALVQAQAKIEQLKMLGATSNWRLDDMRKLVRQERESKLARKRKFNVFS